MSRLCRLPRGIHYAWLVVAVVFVTQLAGAGMRATPSVLIVPWENAFGWSRGTISLAISINLLLYGLLGPFAAALMLRIGVRRTVLGALILLDLAVGASSFMSEPWQLVLTWGILVGLGGGTVAVAFGATVVNRWFTTRRGLAIGIVTAANAAGQLIFLPILASVAESDGWRHTVYVATFALAAVIPLIALFLPERPADVGVLPYGDTGEKPVAQAKPANPLVIAFSALGRGVKSGDFWLLFASFMICGASANGLVGTHLISYCFDNGIAEVSAAGLLAGMGAFNIVGTTLSGWLSDRFDNRVLLMFYFGLRGLSLLYLPYSNFDFGTLSIFALFYGLDWIATVPPTLRLITDIFGKEDAPVIFGWCFAGHQLGAASVAFLAGALRTDLGSYTVPFMISGALCLAAAFFVLWIGSFKRGSGTLVPAAG
jgi:MFS family permease